MGRDRGEDYRWNLDRPVAASDLSDMNTVAIFAGPLLDMYPSIATEDLAGLVKSGQSAVIVDVREPGDYAKAHICGAINIPLASIEKEAPVTLLRDERVIVYGQGPDSLDSAVGADKFATMLFENITRYKGGIIEWMSSGLCTEGVAVGHAA